MGAACHPVILSVPSLGSIEFDVPKVAGDACLSHSDKLPLEAVTGHVTPMQGNPRIGLLGQRQVDIIRLRLMQTKHINERLRNGGHGRASLRSVIVILYSFRFASLAGATTSS
jgi:hypothetical protein